MPAQTTNLFLLEDLEDVGRTSELAESDRAALHAVADWIKTYVVQPHKDLGRAVEGQHRSLNGQQRRGVGGRAEELVGSGQERLPSVRVLLHPLPLSSR